MSDYDDEDIDSELNDLLNPTSEDSKDKPKFVELFQERASQKETTSTENKSTQEDISREKFAPVLEFECDPKPYFNNPNYYKFLLTGMGEVSDKLHKTISNFLKAQDPKDKAVYRSRLIPIYWEMIKHQVSHLTEQSEMPRRLLIRFGALLPNVISAEQRHMLSKIIFENKTGEPIHYADEWLILVGKEEVSCLATDEDFSYKKKGNDSSAIKGRLKKVQGEKEAHISVIRQYEIRQKSVEQSLMIKAQNISKHERSRMFNNLSEPYNPSQRSAMGEVLSIIKELQQIDKEIKIRFGALKNSEEKLKTLEIQAKKEGVATTVDVKVIINEVESIRQMAKMSVGRQGNHMPILMRQFFSSNIKTIATRENIIDLMTQIESIDPGIFRRTFRQKTSRIVPHTILLPCFGDSGLCWEPFEKTNKATSRGRIGIPLFPKDLKRSLLTALADLRWKVAKEKAQHYWMQEGLTGHYYEWFDSKKLRGDVRLRFIQDYILWITKESEGVQKLEKDVRGIFWRDMPFPQQLKDTLRKRGFVFNELYKKDKNREMSDGY